MFKNLTPAKALLWAVAGVAGTALAVAAIGSLSVTAANQGHVVLGVQAGGKTIAGLSYEETRQYFGKLAQQKLDKNAAVLQYEQKSWAITPEEIGLQGKVDEAAQAAYAIGRDENASGLTNLITQMRCALFGTEVTMDADFNPELLNQRLEKIRQEIITQPENAACYLNADGSIGKKMGRNGLSLDMAPIAEELAPQFRALELTAHATLEPTVIQPYVTNADVAAIDTVLGTYTTTYYPGPRGDNIALAASFLNDILVRPGAEISFNALVGPRTPARGFQDAPVIIDGKHEIDSGGGVCQVSTTVYNAVLLAGLTPTQRTSHYYASAYCPPGRDATVADGLLDLQFRNSLAHPVYMLSSAGASEITIYILGTRADLGGKTISLYSTGSSMTPTLYRLWLQNGEVLEQEYLHTDRYSKDTGA